MSLLTAAILIIALGATLVFVRRITQPLTELVEATKRIDSGHLHARVDVQASDEIGKLAASFNLMVDRVENYIGRLEEQRTEIDRAHRHTRTVCGIVQEIGALNSLQGMTSYLIRTFHDILGCRNQMVFLLSSSHRDVLFFLAENQRKAIEDKEIIQQCMFKLEGLTKVSFTNMGDSGPPIALEMFQEAERLAIVPISYNGEPTGALVIACSSKCRCPSVGLDNLHAILSQTAGLLKRAILQEEQMSHLQTRLGISSQFCGMVGKDPEMQMVYKLIEDISLTDATILIQGESGTGKELVARAIHEGSPRKNKPFVVINCSAYPSTLLESELFGHEKGAFTGATRQRRGRFEQAQGGTVFLDEIGEISPSAQIKLLRILQTQKFERLGGESTLALDVRILAATNKDLLGEVKAGRFREDLYYRLNVIPIKLPALRERRNDIPLLARHFLQHFATEQKKDMDGFSPDAMRVLLDYSWPGNVRELENSIEHATALSKGPQVEVYDLPISIRSSESSMPASENPPTLVDYEKDILQQVLEECRWNKKEAARRLGISRNTLYQKLKRYSIARPTTH
jgi:DNA-binding NtrC family response regulator/HAMP domain-containing protein